MREIVLDTETTGLDPAQGHRVVEIGAVELVNHIPSGRTFHTYINPERDMPAEAEAVHGLSSSFLRDKPTFSVVVDEFLEFIEAAPLIIHNAAFDLKFLNAELSYLRRNMLSGDRVIDTLALARRKYPMGQVSLDALCRKYSIDTSKRDKHGALLDSILLAQVYLELIGGRQATLVLSTMQTPARVAVKTQNIRQRPQPLTSRLTETELQAHSALIKELGVDALWLKIEV